MDQRTKKILASSKISPSKIIELGEAQLLEFQNNCENVIGAITVPIGLAGPIKIKGSFANNEYVIPLATTEAALVASVNRGLKAIQECGGIETTCNYLGISRAPVIKLHNPQPVEFYLNWFKNNFNQLAEITKTTSNYLELVKTTDIQIVNNLLYFCFWFNSKDAMGMNMATIASSELLNQFILQELDAEQIALSSNLCADKKPSERHATIGRGHSVIATAVLDQETLNKTLKTTPQKIYEVYHAKVINGSSLAKLLGNNSHHANIVAAIFLATGQDLAHVVEGSHGSTKVEILNNNKLKISINLPALICGTIGGGTKLTHQKEAIGLMNLTNPSGNGKQAHELSEVIAAAVLAGELSLLAAIATNSLATSHSKMRNKT